MYEKKETKSTSELILRENMKNDILASDNHIKFIRSKNTNRNELQNI